MSTNTPRATRPQRPAREPGPAAPVLLDPPAPWFSRESLRGLPTSVTLHVVLLLAMGLWYFAPKLPANRPFDTRLAGSDMGVEDGVTLAGGLNTPLDMAASDAPVPEPVLSAAPTADLADIAAKLAAPASADKPSAGGGMDNPNPGAGAGDGFGLARFGDGGESIRGVAVKVGDPQFTLLWDTPVDLDLHVIEPGGKEIYWEDPKGARGGELDVDNTKGFGPENVYWLHEEEGTGRKVKGMGPPGEYKWFVVYWGGFGGNATPTQWKVRIKHAGKVTVVTGRFRALNERSKTHTLTVEPASVAQ